ncbi:MAG: YdcF family protein [Myxococcales bacterium]|nr:YdcF family protein [Myxococcales bacterium]
MSFPFDAVLILGKELRREPDRALRELRARAAAAAAALRAGARCVVTLEAHLRGQEFSGSALVVGLLQQLGVDDAQILRRDVTRSTREEAVFGTASFEEQGSIRGLVLTAAYHVPRSRRLFQEAGARAEVHAPHALWRWANEREREWIADGEPSPAEVAREARTERVFSVLEAAIRPLPHGARSRLEIGMGGWLRGRG